MLLLCLSCLIMACATYYEKNEKLMTAIYNGRLDEAETMLGKKKWERRKKDILLYYLNKGTVLWMDNKPAESNQYFQKADYYVEDFHTNYAATTISFITNPNITPYYGEGFEQILLHYYATLNYMSLGKPDDALVECKRMQQKLTRITDFYHGKNKYKRDAFAHNLMGIIYETQRDYNNAFIAYRNAYEIYRDDYQKLLSTAVPLQLKKDLIRTAYLTGFKDDAEQYENLFQLKYQPEPAQNGALVLFWNNGLGPVKDQWSINFAVVPAEKGWVNFVNIDLGLSFPFYVGDEPDKKNSLSRLKFIRVAFPKYVTRKLLYNQAKLTCDSLSLSSNLEVAEDINAIAYRSLEDRMARELGEALLRVALKQAAEEALRKENEGLGAALSVVNAISEQADTRNWQLLPYSIAYTRMSLPAGKMNLKLNAYSSDNVYSEQVPLSFTIRPGQTITGSCQTLKYNGYANLPYEKRGW